LFCICRKVKVNHIYSNSDQIIVLASQITLSPGQVKMYFFQGCTFRQCSTVFIRYFLLQAPAGVVGFCCSHLVCHCKNTGSKLNGPRQTNSTTITCQYMQHTELPCHLMHDYNVWMALSLFAKNTSNYFFKQVSQ
jgi:hypothetical protein